MVFASWYNILGLVSSLSLLLLVPSSNTKHTHRATATDRPIEKHILQQVVSESLTLLPLSNNNIFVKYKQTIHIESQSNPGILSKHLEQFPDGVAQLFLSNPDLLAFTASLSQGEWRSTAWGLSPPVGETIDPGGLLTALTNTTKWRDRLWPSLANGLNGLLCSSFGAVLNPDEVMELSLDQIYGDQLGPTTASQSNHSRHLSARLPLEALCTENLTSFIKLLPCRFQSGIARLFRDPMWFAKQHYRTLQIAALRTYSGLEFTGTLSAVVHLSVRVHLEDLLSLPQQQHVTHDPPHHPFVMGWIDRHIFGNVGPVSLRPCLVCEQSKIVIVCPVKYPPLRPVQCYDFHDAPMFCYYLDPFREIQPSLIDPLPSRDAFGQGRLDQMSEQIQMSSSIISMGVHTPLSMGARLVLTFTNPNQNPVSRDIRYFGPFPHFIRPLLHSLQLKILTPESDLTVSGLGVYKRANISWGFPTNPSQRSILYFSAALPPSSTLIFSFNFRKKFLEAGSFCFSLDRGLTFSGGLFLQHVPTGASSIRSYLPGVWSTHEGSVLEFLHHPHHDEDLHLSSSLPSSLGLISRFTPSHYVTLALPDLSMPFNVISITSTLLMMFVVTVMKRTASRPRRGGPKSIALMVIQNVKSFIIRGLRRFSSPSAR